MCSIIISSCQSAATRTSHIRSAIASTWTFTFTSCATLQFPKQQITELPFDIPRQAQAAIHQLRLNGLTSTALYQAFIGRMMSPICPQRGRYEETAEHLLLSCPKWEAERQRNFDEFTDISWVFQDYSRLLEFLMSLGHLLPNIGIAQWARHNSNKGQCNLPTGSRPLHGPGGLRAGLKFCVLSPHPSPY